MDPPEAPGSRLGRTIWTVWGYLSGAVARYLRPEVTDEGNQSVCARTEDIDLKSAANRTDREVKSNNRDSESVKCPSEVRAAASAQWENTSAIQNHSNDKPLHTTDKQTHCAAWSTETHRGTHTAQKDSSEEDHANHERDTTQDLDITGRTEQNDSEDEEEPDENREGEKCAETREDTDVMIRSEQDTEQINMMDHGETEDTGGLEPDEERPAEENKEKTESDEDQGNTDVMIQSEHDEEQDEQINMMDHREDTRGLKPAEEHPAEENKEKAESEEDQGTESEEQDSLEYLTDEGNDISKRLKQDKYSDEIEEFFKTQIEKLMSETEQDEKSQTTQELGENKRFEQKDCDRDQDPEVDKCDVMREDQSNTDVMIQPEQDEEQDEQINVMDRGEDTRGLRPAEEHPAEENKKKFELDEDITERKPDTTEHELSECTESTQQRNPEKHTPSNEAELKMSTVAVETIAALEDTLLMDSENTPESGTGSFVLATNTQAMFPGEPGSGLEPDWTCSEEILTELHDPQTPAGQQDSDETKHGSETHQEQLSLRAQLTGRTTLSSEDEEEEASGTENRSPVIRGVTFQILQLTDKLTQKTIGAFSETQRNTGVSGTAGTENRGDVKLVSTELLGEPGDVEKTALEYIEEITNQVLKEMIDTETELLIGLSAEEPADVEHQEPALCVSAEQEQKIPAEVMDSSEEHNEEQINEEQISEEQISEEHREEQISGEHSEEHSEEHISGEHREEQISEEQSEADGHHEQVQKSMSGEPVWSGQEDLMEVSRSGTKRAFDQMSTDLAEKKTERRFDLILQAFEDSSLDFSVQKCRIAVKNPLVRPPKNPRKLLFRASVEPLGPPPGPALNRPVMGVKLPGLGAGPPRLRRTETGQKTEAETTLQQKSVREDSVKPEQVTAKPKWTPPRHPGMGSPFMMAELKNKLKKPVQE